MQTLCWHRLAAALLCGAMLAGCTSIGGGDHAAPSTVHHMVLLWLKSPGNAAHRQRIIAATRELAGIPEVNTLSVGPVVPSSRPIVDASFDVGIHMTFASERAMSRYLTHPRHQAVVRDVIAPLTARILVYDFRE